MVIKQSSPASRVPGSFLLPGLVSLKTVASVLQPILHGAFRHLRLSFFFATSGTYLCVCPLYFRQAIDSQVPEETLCFSLLPCHSFISGSFCAEQICFLPTTRISPLTPCQRKEHTPSAAKKFHLGSLSLLYK